MRIGSVLKVTASAGEALEWDSRKRNVRHPMASQGCLKTPAPSLQHKVPTQNLRAEGGRKLSGATERCPAPRTENFQFQPQGLLSVNKKPNLSSTGHNLKNKLVSLGLGV